LYNKELSDKVERLRKANIDRDTRMRAVSMVRQGQANMLFKDLFPGEWPKPIISNTIDVIAQDVAEQVGVLPTFTASGDSVINESQRSKADKLTKITNHYVYASRLGSRLIQGADRFNTYGFLPVRVEAQYSDKRPHIHLDDPMGAYYEKDRWGKVTLYVKTFRQRARELAAMFPEHYDLIVKKGYGGRDDAGRFLTVARIYEADKLSLILLDGDNTAGLVLSSTANPLGKIPVAVAERPTIDGEQRGAFDDVLWVFAARAKLALLSLEATQKSVEAPIALPQDVQELAFGPDSILRSQSPEKIRRIGLELPQSAIVEDRILDDEIKFGARYPEARAGQSDSSVVTGRGVQALMSGFDARVKTNQMIIGESLTDALMLCLEMDETIWPDTKRTVNTVTNGTPYELKYTPSKDIKGDYRVNYEYGLLAGLDPNRALVWGLQGLGAGLFSKSFMRRNLPLSMDVAEEERVIDVERLRDATMGSVEALAGAIPQMASQGQNPQEIVRIMGELVEARKKGVPVEKAVMKAFKPPEPEPPAQGDGNSEQMASMMQDPSVGSAAPQAEGGVQMEGVRPEPPGMMQLLAQLSGSGQPGTSVRTVRQSRI